MKTELYVRLAELLEERGMTQRQLVDLTGLRPATVSELANNLRTTIHRSHITKIADALGIEDIRQLIELRK